MKELKFDSGVETFDLNGKIQISFNPTDPNFVERIYNAFEELDKKQETYKRKVEETSDNKEVFEFVRERDAEMRAIIDSVFEAPVSEAVFGEMNVYSLSGGLPVWCNLMLAVMEEIDDRVTREQKAKNPMVEKYTKKYHR